jgi:magnesium-transporting ATPase (P-type)
MKIHHLSIDEAFASLQTGPRGLGSTEVERRLGECGRNEVSRVEREPLALTLVKEFGHFFAIILSGAAGLAFLADWRDPSQGMATLGFAIVGVVIVNGLFSFWQAYHAEQALSALQKLLPHSTKTVRDGAVQLVEAAELVPGDLVLLTPWANIVFGTAPISPAVWFFAAPFALGMVAIEELRKWLVRSRGRPHAAPILAG